MTDKMTAFEFSSKVESEGFWYAFTEYGLTSDDLDDDAPIELKLLVSDLTKTLSKIQNTVCRLENLLEEILDSEDFEYED